MTDDKAIRLVVPVDVETKARIRRKGAGKPKKRFRRQLPELTRAEYSRPVKDVTPLRDGFNAEDFKVAREIVERYCPAKVPKRLKSRFKGPLDLFESLLLYVMAVEFGWHKDDIAPNVGRCRRVQDTHVRLVEDVRDEFAFIEVICGQAEAHRHGLI